MGPFFKRQILQFFFCHIKMFQIIKPILTEDKDKVSKYKRQFMKYSF